MARSDDRGAIRVDAPPDVVATGRPPEPAPGRQPWLLPLLVVVIGTVVSVLDISIVNIALPAMQRDFGCTPEDITWVSTSYALVEGIIVPASVWLSNRFGPTRTYRFALLGFVLASVLCSLAWSLPSMTFFRVVQAIPGGFLPVVTLTILNQIVPAEKIGIAMGIYGMGMVFAPAVGPTLGGYIVDDLSWRLIFAINVPLGVLGFILSLVVLPRLGGAPSRRFDVYGFASIATGLVMLLLALSKGADWGWSSYRILMLLVGGVLLLALFVVIELEVDAPLLDVRIVRVWNYANSLLLVVVLAIGLFGVLFFVPLYVQENLGIQPMRTGLMMLPEAIVMACVMPVAGLLYDRIGPRLPAVVGLVITAIGTEMLCGINADVPLSHLVLWTCIRGAGTGLALMAIMTGGMMALPEDKRGEAGAINTVVQRVSSALGLGVLSTLASSWAAQLMADRSAMVTASDASTLLGGRIDTGSARPFLLGLYQRLQNEVVADAYALVFLLITVVTVIGAVLAVTLRRPAADQPVMSGLPSRTGSS